MPPLFDDLIKFAEQLSDGPVDLPNERVDLVTWSMGGDVGINAALMRPDFFRSAVHFEPVPNIDMSEVAGYDAAMDEIDRKFESTFLELENGNELEAAYRFVEAVFDMQVTVHRGRAFQVLMQKTPDSGNEIGPDWQTERLIDQRYLSFNHRDRRNFEGGLRWKQ